MPGILIRPSCLILGDSLASGLDERFSTVSAYGHGSYFADAGMLNYDLPSRSNAILPEHEIT